MSDFHNYRKAKQTDYSTTIVTIILAVFIISAFGIFGFWIRSMQCQSRWEGTYKTEFGLFSGCRVFLDGKLIPENNVRAIQ